MSLADSKTMVGEIWQRQIIDYNIFLAASRFVCFFFVRRQPNRALNGKMHDWKSSAFSHLSWNSCADIRLLMAHRAYAEKIFALFTLFYWLLPFRRSVGCVYCMCIFFSFVLFHVPTILSQALLIIMVWSELKERKVKRNLGRRPCAELDAGC